MAWNLGLLGATAVPAGAFELISTTVLTSNTASVTFSAIPQDYKHLQIRLVHRGARNFNFDQLRMRFNSVTTNSYNAHNLFGSGGSVFTNSTGTLTYIEITESAIADGQTSGAFTAGVIDILDYASTSKNTTSRSLTGGAGSVLQEIRLSSGLFISTSAISSLTLFCNIDQLLAGSRYSLYGIRGD